MEDLLPILVLVGYAVLSLLGRLVQGKKRPDVDDSADPVTVDTMLRDMLRQAGVEPEPSVPEEHRPTRSEHRPTRGEHRQDAAETAYTVTEHRRTASETRVTRSEHVPRASDHLVSPGEHLKGDAHLPPVPKIAPPKARRKRSRFASALVSNLRGEALGRAIVLREILGPPVSLRTPDERG